MDNETKQYIDAEFRLMRAELKADLLDIMNRQTLTLIAVMVSMMGLMFAVIKFA